MTFKYRPIKRPDGNQIKTPSIPVTLIGNSRIKIEFMALIDSGADLSIIPKEVADLLNLNLEGKKDKSRGIGGEVDVINTIITINIKKGHEDYSFTIPIQVILDKPHIPILLGRAGFFDEFKIIFDQINERVLLKKVVRQNY